MIRQNPDLLITPERRKEEVRFYIMFQDGSQRERAKEILQKMLQEDKQEGIYKIPAGPDYPLTQKNILNGDFKEYHNDENPAAGSFGLEISFSHTPGSFASPESLENFILEQFQQRGLKLKRKNGHAEAYEVVGGVPQDYEPKI